MCTRWIRNYYVSLIYNWWNLMRFMNYQFISFHKYSLVSIESFVPSRRSWNVFCWGNHLSAGLADVLLHLICKSVLEIIFFDSCTRNKTFDNRSKILRITFFNLKFVDFQTHFWNSRFQSFQQRLNRNLSIQWKLSWILFVVSSIDNFFPILQKISQDNCASSDYWTALRIIQKWIHVKLKLKRLN